MMGFIPKHAVVWFEIPVTDIEKARAFYQDVLESELSEMEGPNPMLQFSASGPDMIAGHLYPGRPAAPGTGPTIHLSVGAPLEAAMERVAASGGQVVSPIIQIPAGRFVYCLDPDGNSFGLFN